MGQGGENKAAGDWQDHLRLWYEFISLRNCVFAASQAFCFVNPVKLLEEWKNKHIIATMI